MPLLAPDHYYTDIHAIDLDALSAEGIDTLLLDLDNTLLPRNSAEVPRELEEWMGRAREAGLKACLVSNNWKGHVRGVAEELSVPLVARALKPLPFAFRRALRICDAGPGSAAVIGDQMFTDVVGGRVIGARKTILVLPLSGSDLPHTRLLRMLEARILAGREAEK
jgi:HAD superfamily phosphatase (TIGR01668 family)